MEGEEVECELFMKFKKMKSELIQVCYMVDRHFILYLLKSISTLIILEDRKKR